MSVDAFGGDNVSNRPQIVIDVSAGFRIGDHWQAFFRPWFRKGRPSTPDGAVPPWDAEIYQAGVRYERSGTIGTRVDLGYIVSPMGLGLLDSRANLNPTIATHLSYVVPMPSFDSTGPRASAITSTYPLGAAATLSGSHWDARAAVVTTSPTRIYMLGNSLNPKQSPNVVVGAGVTPIVGLRVGVAAAHGAYATADEVNATVADARDATIVGAEAEYAFGYTVLRAEVLRTAFETTASGAPGGAGGTGGTDAIAYEWFIQGIQTLAPRWFVAARHEGTSAPPLRTAVSVGPRTDLRVVEATVGFRATPEITLRGGYYCRQFYGATTWDSQAGVSIVWARRWW